MNKLALLSQEYKRRNLGFTLVELIIIISILGILAVLAFISFRDYLKSSRDGQRLATVKNIESGFSVFHTRSGNYPKPDASFTLLRGGDLMGYQGVLGDNTARIIQIKKTPLDPILETPYIYGIDATGNKYQILSFMEEGE